MQKIYLTILALIATPCFATTNIVPQYKHYDFLAGGFSPANYAQCSSQIGHCPLDGKSLKKSCVQQTLKTKQVCSQYNKLLKALDMSFDMVDVRKLAAFSLIHIHFLADGQDWYQIITPQGDVIDTKLDPRSIDQQLAQQYSKKSFMLVNQEEPKYRLHSDGIQEIISSFQVTDSCVACPVIGNAKISFIFDKDNTLQTTKLLSFSS